MDNGSRAAECVAWWLFGGDRDDWLLPSWCTRRQLMSWLRGRVTLWRYRQRKGGKRGG